MNFFIRQSCGTFLKVGKHIFLCFSQRHAHTGTDCDGNFFPADWVVGELNVKKLCAPKKTLGFVTEKNSKRDNHSNSYLHTSNRICCWTQHPSYSQNFHQTHQGSLPPKIQRVLKKNCVHPKKR